MDCVASEHPAVISPCLTILEKLSNQFYDELKTEVQVSLNGIAEYKRNVLYNQDRFKNRCFYWIRFASSTSWCLCFGVQMAEYEMVPRKLSYA